MWLCRPPTHAPRRSGKCTFLGSGFRPQARRLSRNPLGYGRVRRLTRATGRDSVALRVLVDRAFVRVVVRHEAGWHPWTLAWRRFIAVGTWTTAGTAVAAPFAAAQPGPAGGVLAARGRQGSMRLTWRCNLRDTDIAPKIGEAASGSSGYVSPSRNLIFTAYGRCMSGEPANFNARAMARWLAARNPLLSFRQALLDDRPIRCRRF